MLESPRPKNRFTLCDQLAEWSRIPIDERAVYDARDDACASAMDARAAAADDDDDEMDALRGSIGCATGNTVTDRNDVSSAEPLFTFGAYP